MDLNKSRNINLSRKELKGFNKLHLKSSDIKDIEELNLSYNNIESTDNLSHLTNLKALNISNNLLTKIYGLPKTLTQLNASCNKIDEIFSIKNSQSLSCFDQMINLAIIDLSKNNISKLPPNLFETSKQLTHIDFSHNKISDQLECFAKLPYLAQLNLSHNKITDFKVLSQLEGCLVRKLDISSNLISKQNTQKCEQILNKILPQITYLCLTQQRSTTPQSSQSKKTQKIENSKNGSAITKKSQRESISPFKRRLSAASTNASFNTLSTQRMLKFSNNGDFDQKDLFQNQFKNLKNEQNIFQSLAYQEQNKQVNSDIFQPFCTKYNPQNYHADLFQEQQQDHKAQEKQKIDQELINQQNKMIEDLFEQLKAEQRKEIKQTSFEEILFKEDNVIKKQMNLTYLKAKFDILLFAFSHLTNQTGKVIDENLQSLMKNKIIFSSEQKYEISQELLNKLNLNL